MRNTVRLLGLLTVLALGLGWGRSAHAQVTVVLQGDPTAGQDTHIAAASSVQNFGASTVLITNSQPNAQSRILLRFDLSAIPAGATIASANLELYYVFARVNTSEPLRVHRLLQTWTEAGATWRAYNGTNNWAAQGGDFDPTVAASATLDGTVNVWKLWSIAPLVQGWVSGTYANNGLILESPDLSGNNERRFNSSENASATLRPKLTVTYVSSNLGLSTKTVSSTTPVTGQILTYTIVVKDTGTQAAPQVVVTDAVDTTKLANITPGQGGTLSGNTITWNRTTTPALASVNPTPGGDLTLSFTARVLPTLADGTVIANQAFLSSSFQTGIPSDDPSTAAAADATLATVREPTASLYKRILEKNGAALANDPSNPPGVTGALTAAAAPGDVLTYAVFFTNTGTRAASSFIARDGVPANTAFVPDAFALGKGIRLILGVTTDLTNAADADAGAFSAATLANPDDPATPVNGLVTVAVGSLSSGSSGSIRFKVRVR